MKRRGLALAVLLGLPLLAGGCSSLEDKRIFQYLNRSGFGQRYHGNASEENFAAVGDAVTVTDSVNPEYLTLPPQQVDIDGTIDMPEVGNVHVAGLTAGEIESLLTALYRPYFEDLRVRVRIRTLAKSFYVFGEVAREGPHPFPGDVTLLEAVLRSAPNRVTANLARVRLVRGDPVDPLVVVVDLERLLRTGDTTYNLRLRENDIVIVPPTVIGAIGNALTQLVYPVTQILGTVVGVLGAVTYYEVRRNFF
ncbi:MAG TPA: polysaccharide biosynthesis/export family protein [Planctomycetota bacterium]|nr:polysaccharide biosynthesis/export family protein [Planctomycetota bacterium]